MIASLEPIGLPVAWTSAATAAYALTAKSESNRTRYTRIAEKLGTARHDLARRQRLGRNTITRLERGGVGEARTLTDLRRVLEAAGVQFLDDGRALGVRYPPPG